ncbi:S-adenosyl-L-methionine-dependent methyltransferase [Zopfia rhizophila CBS 207.26]|uniref:S-adenosyl-L-methionine-dependent methyltransferase n=1 Tax=Zopfia rhizophila CBS 207.26 TaxID=1314779 RepID=A0A6A6EPX5_9PEZI|nr:S-adenosyl-L-methionine-dependent methyltransferase [Zopfia rhizophila CBS 207.26]
MANAFPADSTASIPEIAEKSGMHPDDAETIIRHALTYRLFKQQPNGTIAHSAATRAITTVPHLHAWVIHALENMWRDAPFIVPAMEKWPGSQEVNETAFNLAQRKEGPFFKEIGKSEKSVRQFAEAMKFFLDKPAMRPEFAVEGYAWDVHAQGTVVDIGGSHGVIAFKLAERYPAMKIIVQDRPEVVASAPKPEKGQVEFQAHDFFMAQPVKEADVYFFRYIFHSWSDKYCIAILRALIPALKVESRVLIMEHIVPGPGILSPFQERPIRHFDMAMKESFNAKERSESDWKNLLGDADKRFSVVEVRRPAGSQLGIVVAEWAG